jgi:hypothetical protein
MMRSSARHQPAYPPARRLANRRGIAIIVTLILTIALGALALSAVYLASGTRIGSGLSNRAADLQFAADAALQTGKSYINADPDAMPDDGYREITFNGGVLKDASGDQIPNVKVRVWAGPTGATSGQFGAFGSVIAEATDNTGGRVVRRLELAQENFARFAYWSNRENNAGTPIWFGGGDVIFGPTWSNDTVRIFSKGALPFAAQFRDVFGTARVVIQSNQADFWKGFTQNERPIPLPAPAALADLPAYATSGRLNFNAPNAGDETQVRMRLEFVNIDIDNDGSNTDPQDGFVRAYTLAAGTASSWLRGDEDAVAATMTQRRALCGEWLRVGAVDRFFTIESHENPDIRTFLGKTVANGGANLTGAQLTALAFTGAALTAAQMQEVLSRTGAIVPNNRSQCFLAGAPELNMGTAEPYGGTPARFMANPADGRGSWQLYGGVIDPRVTARVGADEAAYLFPLHRSVNPGARGVIHVEGTAGISGLLVGRVTLRTTGSVVVLDDVRYGTNPATTGRCVDVLGILAGANVVVADNMMNNQVNSLSGSTTQANRRILDDTKDLILHAVVMAMNTSFRVQNFGTGPTTGNPCNAVQWGRGCLMLLGGLIQEARGPVGTTAGTGYGKQYTYDRCANLRPPPYFPTTGRYLDNRYLEVDPVGFDIATLFARLSP